MSNKIVLGTFLTFIFSISLLLNTQNLSAQQKCEELNKNNPQLLIQCKTLGN